MQTTTARPPTTTLRPGRYEIDPGASTITFRMRHMFGLLPVRGRLAIHAGTVDVADPIGESRIRAQVNTASFATGNPQRDEHVRSADFLDADRYPVMTFAADGPAGGTVAGMLVVRGVARPVTLTIRRYDVSPHSFTLRATTRLDRTEFGVTGSPRMVGRHLDVTLDITGAARSVGRRVL